MKGDLMQKSKQQLKRVSETFSFLGTDRQPLAARLLWVKRRNTRSEKMTSALALRARDVSPISSGGWSVNPLL
jgi:hypothetical protein